MKHTYHLPSEYILIDCETTGLTPGTCEIIEVGILKISQHKIVDQYHQLIKPSEPIPYFITRLTGISNEDVQDAPSFDEIADDLLNFIGDHHIVGHNVNFDIRFINHFTNDSIEKNRSYTDSLYAAKKLKPGLQSYKLEALCNTFDINHDQMHNAIEDCRCTYHVLQYLYR